MSQLIQKSIKKAMELHEGQFRKGDEKIPYVLHPLEMAIILSRFTTSEALIVAAVLHDTLEDCEYTFEELEEEFGKEAAYFVSLLTENKSVEDFWQRKIDGLNKIKEQNVAMVIKAIDALTNMRDLVALVKKNGQSAWQFFKGSKELKLDYYRLLLETAKEALPSEILINYAETLKDLEYSEYLTGGSALGFVK